MMRTAASMRRGLLLAACCVGACGIEARSPLFQCDGPADCAEGRVCRDGWCVIGSAPEVDAGGRPPDAGMEPKPDASLPDASIADAAAPDASDCPAPCTRCENDRCFVDCDADGSCPDRVVCPPGLACTVACAGVSSCAAGVDCTASTDCAVTCTARDACAGGIACGPGACTVGCTARNTCAEGIDCANSCSCDTDCSGTGACDIEPACPPGSLFGCRSGVDCTTSGFGCDVCE